MDETKEINHHGQVREVSTNEPGQEANVKDPIKEFPIKDYFDFAFQPEITETQNKQILGTKIAFEDLVHNDEQTQDAALKEYYAKAEVKDETKLKIMNACIFFSRTIKPAIIIIFVLIYWGSGLYRTNQCE